jgi:tRNA-dihydrouridine synthase A
MHRYAAGQVARGTPLRAIARHMLGLYQGRPGARAWRRTLSDAPALARNDPALLLEALDGLEATAALSAAPA